MSTFISPLCRISALPMSGCGVIGYCCGYGHGYGFGYSFGYSLALVIVLAITTAMLCHALPCSAMAFPSLNRPATMLITTHSPPSSTNCGSPYISPKAAGRWLVISDAQIPSHRFGSVIYISSHPLSLSFPTWDPLLSIHHDSLNCATGQCPLYSRFIRRAPLHPGPIFYAI
ncbi:hypothetical protein F5X96DRAFT_219027 [Biscogniauxia mediterranea]|nr:hypothetical protein F5X96DRAFT_219027 [Biscogniauxia mediterranea]